MSISAAVKDVYTEYQETIRNFAWRLLQIFGKQGIIFLIFAICAKLLTPYDFGVYNYVLNFVFFLVMFGDFGISTATSKYVAQYGLTDQKKLRSVLFNSASIIIGITVVIAILSLLLAPRYLQGNSKYVFYLLPLLFLAPMTSLYDGIYRGLKQFKRLAIMSSAVGAVSLTFVYFFIHKFGLIGALIFQNLFYFLLFVVLAAGYRDFNFKFSRTVMKEIGSYSVLYGLAVAGNYFFIRFGILILGHYGYIQQIATYELLNKIFLVLVIPFTMLGQVIAPDFTVLSVNGEFQKIYQKLKSYTLAFAAVGTVIGLVMLAAMPVVIRLFFKSYDTDLFRQILPFSIIILTTNIWAATIDAGITIPTGFAGLMAKFYVFLGIATSLLGVFLTRHLGYMGVIYSFALANTFMAVGLRAVLFLKIKSQIR